MNVPGSNIQLASSRVRSKQIVNQNRHPSTRSSRLYLVLTLLDLCFEKLVDGLLMIKGVHDCEVDDLPQVDEIRFRHILNFLCLISH